MLNIAIVTSKYLKTNRAVASVKYVLDNLDAKKYQASLVYIDELVKDRALTWTEEEMSKDPRYMPFEEIEKHSLVKSMYELGELKLSKLREMFAAAIVVIFNDYGEDGKVLGLLDVAGVPYLSSGVLTSALCFNKRLTKIVLAAHGVRVPRDFVIEPSQTGDQLGQRVVQELGGFPVMLKRTSSGASYGVWYIESEEKLGNQLEKMQSAGWDELVAEEHLAGEEFTVGMTGDYREPIALPPVLIKPRSVYFDYEAKYQAGMAEELCPAPISKELEAELKETAVAVYRIVKGEHMARIDLIRTADGQVSVLEVNTIPGMAPSSLFPKELAVAGIAMSEVIDNFVAGIER